MLNQEWLSTFAALGMVENGEEESVAWRAVGAGVFLSARDMMWVATAGHVMPDEDAPRAALRLDVDGSPKLVPLGSIQRGIPGLKWIRDDSNDLAVALLPRLPNARLKTIPEAFWVSADMELTSMTCLVGGCPLGLPGLDARRAMPVVLNGIVAGIDHEQQRIFITAPTYKGNSGGPVFIDRGIRGPDGGFLVGPTATLLGGVVIGTSTFEASGSARPLHLGVAVHVQLLRTLLAGDAASEQVQIALRSR